MKCAKSVHFTLLFFSYNKVLMINGYSLPKVFYEDLYKAFIFHVEHPRKVLYTNYSSVTLKKYDFDLTLKKVVLKKDICIKK